MNYITYKTDAIKYAKCEVLLTLWLLLALDIFLLTRKALISAQFTLLEMN